MGITLFSELFSWYAYFIDAGFLESLKGTVFESNYWIGNTYAIISYLFYINYFKWYLQDVKSIRIVNTLTGIFIVINIIEIIFFGGFFERIMPLANIFGTLFIFISIAFYYLELLKSDKILAVQRSLPFYVSVGALLFHLCTTPIFIYSVYYSISIDPDFVNLYRHVIFGINILLYSIYILGFLVCSQTPNPYWTRKDF